MDMDKRGADAAGTTSHRRARLKLSLSCIGLVTLLAFSGLFTGPLTGVPATPGPKAIPAEPVNSPDGGGNAPQAPAGPEWKTYPSKAGPFSFPDDEGMHPDASEEWWYVNSHLMTSDGRRIDVMVCFYKHGIVAASLFDESRGLYLNHTETYIDLTREIGHLGLSYGPNELRQVEGRPFDYRLDYRSREFSVSLGLESLKNPLVVSGDGVIRMGRGASYYYSLTDMAAEGTITVGTEQLAVSGSSWMDRQWGSWSPKLHWDWFSIMLEGGVQVLAYRLLEQGLDQPVQEYVSVIDALGDACHFNRSEDYCDIVFDYDGYWQSPTTGKLYSSGWGLTVPRLGLSIDLTPLSADQETLFPADEPVARERMPFWEGACRAAGTFKGQAVAGRAFVETTCDYGHEQGDLVVIPKEYVQDGDGSRLVLMVENQGGYSLNNVEVQLVLGSPYDGGKKLVTYHLNNRHNSTYRTDDLPNFGSVPIYIVVDPDNHLAELNERNNIAIAVPK